MNKKRNFAKMALLSALLCGVAGPTFVGCKDYDDDIKDLQEQVDANKTLIASIQEAIANKKFVSDYKATDNGYELIFSDGTKLPITNGAPGLQGSTIIPQFRVNGGYWEVSVDKGVGYKQVLDDKNQPVKATPDASEMVSIDKDGYLWIGDNKTELKENPACPSIIYDETTKTFKIKVGDHEMVLLAEGSAYNGLQTLIYRKMAADDIRDVVEIASLSYTPTAATAPVLLMSLPGKAEFKVFPKTFDTKIATYEFFDTHLSRAAATPSLNYVDGSAKVADGILSVEFTVADLALNRNYLSSMNVTLNNNTACSDYFAVCVNDYQVEDFEFFVKSEKNEEVPVAQVKGMTDGTIKAENDAPHRGHYTFVYTESYSLKDSIGFGHEWEVGENYIYKSIEDLGFGEVVSVSYAATTGAQNGIFSIAADGTISVAKDKQASAINEYCYVTVTYTLKNKEQKTVYTAKQDLAIQAVRAAVVDPEVQGYEILTANGSALNLEYNATETQVIELDVRAFEANLGGRDAFNKENSKDNSRVWGLGYMDKETLKAVTTKANLPTDLNPSKVKDIQVADGEMYLYFQAGEEKTTNLDKLYLIVGKKTTIAKNKFYLLNENCDGKTLIDDKYVYLKDLEVRRDIDIQLKPEYSLTMTGVWAPNGTYSMISENLNLMYNVIKPLDLELEFALAADQSAEVKKLIADGQLVLDPATNKITISPVVDLATKQLYVKYDIFDKNENKTTRKPLKSNQLTIQNPVGNLTGTVVSQTFQVVNLTDTYNTVNDGNKSLTLKDVRNNSLLTYTKATAADKDDAKYEMSAESKTMYGTKTGFGITYKLDKAAADFGIMVNGNGIISLDNAKISSGINFEKTATVTMTITHDWGTTSVTYNVVVKKTN